MGGTKPLWEIRYNVPINIEKKNILPKSEMLQNCHLIWSKDNHLVLDGEELSLPCRQVYCVHKAALGRFIVLFTCQSPIVVPANWLASSYVLEKPTGQIRRDEMHYSNSRKGIVTSSWREQSHCHSRRISLTRVCLSFEITGAPLSCR
jgi:hypothetical protein